MSDSLENAKPIFLANMNLAANCQAGFRREFTLPSSAASVRLRITAATFYRIYCNGRFAFHGPARAAHRFARVDDIDLSPFAVVGNNALAIEVAGYNEENIYVTGDSSFLIAELVLDGSVIDATDVDWIGIRLHQRKQIVERFSHARCANEIYDLDQQYADWRTAPAARNRSNRSRAGGGADKILTPCRGSSRPCALPVTQIDFHSRHSARPGCRSAAVSLVRDG